MNRDSSQRCEHEGRDQDDGAEAKAHERFPANHQKLGEKHRVDSSLQPSEETNTF